VTKPSALLSWYATHHTVSPARNFVAKRMSCFFCARDNTAELFANVLTMSGADVARTTVVGTITGNVVLVDVEDVVVATTGATVGATAEVVEVVADVVDATVVVVVVVVDVVVVVVVVPVLMSAPALSATKLSPMCDVLEPVFNVFSDPRRPLPPLPQHFTAALSSIAHVCATPADTASTLRPVPRSTVANASPISPEPSPRLF
jgi:hypothetical protein